VKQVFVAQHPTEAHLVKGLLENRGIAAEIRGESLFAARGGVPVTPETLPSVWVLDDGDREAALAVLRDFDPAGAATTAAGEQWICPRCDVKLEPQFNNCWQCGANRPGAG
jgi:hypothetical protein